MTFIYTYRDKTGMIREADIDAASRTEVFTKLKMRGISPIKVYSSRAVNNTRSRHFLNRSNIVLIILLFVSSILVFYGLWSRSLRGKITISSNTEISNSQRNIKGQLYSSSRTVIRTTNSIPTRVPEKTLSLNKDLTQPTTSGVKNENINTNDVIYAPTGRGKREVTYLDGRVGELGAVRIFTRPFEQSLLAATRPAGSGQLLRRALLMYTDDQIIKMLKEPVSINVNEDSEGVIERKLNVQTMKEQILTFIENGGSVEAAFEFYARQSAEERAFQLAARKELHDIVKTGDEIAIRAYIDEKNNELKKRGLSELRPPSFLRQTEIPNTIQRSNRQ